MYRARCICHVNRVTYLPTYLLIENHALYIPVLFGEVAFNSSSQVLDISVMVFVSNGQSECIYYRYTDGM